MKDKKVLVAGELNVDVLLNSIAGFPVVGKEILANDMLLTLGSSSAIFAANLAALGVGVHFSGLVGNDVYGKLVLEELKKKGVETGFVRGSSSHGTGATIVLNYGQDRANVTYCGAMDHFSLSDIPVGQLAEFDHLHLSSYFLQKGLQKDIVKLFRLAKEKGLSTSLDIQWDPADKWDFPYQACLPVVDLFMPNEGELLAMTGCVSIQEACEKLGPFANIIVIKRGLRGSVAYEKGVFTAVAAFEHDRFVDAIGAGDSFNAGFIWSYLRDGSLAECLRTGNLAGAVNTTASGGTGAFSTPEAFAETVRLIFNIEIK